MCEISASQLVTTSNVAEALTMSTRQKGTTGNDLPRLRKAAMDVILRRGRRGVSEIGRSTFFKKALEEERSIIVPTLFQGAMEAIEHWTKKGGKRDISELSCRSFRDLDKEDTYKREKERKRGRKERTKKDHSKMINAHLSKYEDHTLSDFSDEELFNEDRFLNNWVPKGSLKRMSQHNMDSITRRSSSRASLNLTNIPRASSQRRSSRNSSQKLDIFLRSRDK